MRDEEAGLDPARPPATWQDWLDAARKLTKSNGGRHGTPRRRWRWSSLTNLALEQLNQYGRGWFATDKPVAVRKAMED